MMFIFLSSGTFVNKDSTANDESAYVFSNGYNGISQIMLAVSKESSITKSF